MHLIVTEPFGGHARGEKITADVRAVLASHPSHVVKVAGEPEPEAPAPAKKGAAKAPPATSDQPAAAPEAP